MDSSKNEQLLARAIEITKEAGMGKEMWAVGGGTVLSHYYDHRLSKDIDIFINDPQFLSSLSPRLNEIANEAAGYDETGSFISLTFPEGEVDFIVGSQLSKFKPQEQPFLNQVVNLEDPVEIIAKKIVYRGHYAVSRDIFDLAVVSSDRMKDIVDIFSKHPNEVKKFYERLSASTKNRDELYSITQKGSILPGGMKFIGKEVKLCKKIESQLRQRQR